MGKDGPAGVRPPAEAGPPGVTLLARQPLRYNEQVAAPGERFLARADDVFVLVAAGLAEPPPDPAAARE